MENITESELTQIEERPTKKIPISCGKHHSYLQKTRTEEIQLTRNPDELRINQICLKKPQCGENLPQKNSW